LAAQRLDAVRALLGLGSNLGDREEMLRQARALLGAIPGTSLTRVSSLYATAPIGGPEQEDYLNQVVELWTTLTAHELLAAIGRIEAALGRERLVRWGPRTIDVDILWYDGSSIAEADLEVPHPRLEQRRFVLEPLAELAPDLVLPSGRTAGEALESVSGQAVARFEDRRVDSGGRRPAEDQDEDQGGCGDEPPE
jgi:2-amino-4-hydroxy-6-hydroxymethyldihydropteridine diphosphokinase